MRMLHNDLQVDQKCTQMTLAISILNYKLKKNPSHTKHKNISI